MAKSKLTKQQADPHPELVGCRNAIEKHITQDRKKAAHICTHLTDAQVELVLAAGDDKAKVQEALKHVEVPPAPEPAKDTEETKKTTRKK